MNVLSDITELDEAKIRFDYVSKLFRKDNRPKLRQLVNGELAAPLIVEFDPTTACNFSCPECISADLLNKDSIETDRIQSLMKEFGRAGVQGIIFIGGGEPLAHKSMPKPIYWAREAGLAIGITTNGSLIERHMDAIAECVDWTRVSMDAGTEEMFLTFRPNKIQDSFRKILIAMENLSAKKKGTLGYSFLVMRRANGPDYISNASEIYQAAKIAKDIGCDYFEFKPMVDINHYLVPYDDYFINTVKEQHEMCLELVGGGFEIIAPSSISHVYENKVPTQSKSYCSCPAMELRTLVTPSGIYPCPYLRGREDKKLGLITEQPFDEFWKSSERKSASGKVDPSKDCNFYCIRHRTNEIVTAVKNLEGQGIPILDHLKQQDIKDVFL